MKIKYVFRLLLKLKRTVDMKRGKESNKAGNQTRVSGY